MFEHSEEKKSKQFPILTARQRRILGALLEKGFTTPTQYPLTLNALTLACNQKSNREPVTNYTEEEVYESLQQLMTLQLVGEIHSESARVTRYRHYVRHHYDFSEIQWAIITELLLRGRQQLGELRTRASRMIPISGLDVLRDELQSLIAMGVVRASGPLQRRGVEVDHNLYTAQENPARWSDCVEEQGLSWHAGSAPSSTGEWQELVAQVEELKVRVNELEAEIEKIQTKLSMHENDA